MDLMKQCQIWNENDEFHRIIEAIEALPPKERTPELVSELGRAYNNIAGPEETQYFEKALELLKSVEEYFSEEHNWNFRIGYAYYYLDREGKALRHFKKALKARPGDGDSQYFIDECRKILALPRFEKSFRQRTIEAWTAFEKGEKDLRRLMDHKDRKEVGEELIEKCSDILYMAFADISFELGFNGEKYELILTPEGDRTKLFELVYFQKHAPASLLKQWNILVGRQPSTGFSLGSFGINISAEDVQVWIEQKGENPENSRVGLTMYCEKLLPLLREEEGKAYWMLYTLTDQVLGEIPSMDLIDSLDAVDSPGKENGILLSELSGVLTDRGWKLTLDPNEYLDKCYTAYEMKPDQDPDADWRMDVFAGVTQCPAVINEYLSGSSDIMDAFHEEGIVPGFLFYSLSCFADEEERGKVILDFRDALEEAVQKKAGEDAIRFLGGASGIYCGYLDFIAWDLQAVLDAAAEFFENSPVEWANFHSFRRDVNAVRLK